MKKIRSSIAVYLCILYSISFMGSGTYYNWKYAKENGFVKWLFFGSFVSTAKAAIWPYYAFANITKKQKNSEQSVSMLEYVDNEYNFSFQYPSTWNIQPIPERGETGEIRVLIKSPRSISLMAIVGQIGTSITKDAYLKNENREELVDNFINLTVDSVYKKTSKNIGATRMVVGEHREIPSEIGIKFYISTVHYVIFKNEEYPIILTGIHIIPYNKEYLVGFIMGCPLDPKAVDDNETFKNVFNSFHVLGEKPL